MTVSQPRPAVEPFDVCMRNTATGENWVPLGDAERIKAHAAQSESCPLCRLRRWIADRRPEVEPWDSSFPGPLSKPITEEEEPSHGDKNQPA